LGICDECLFLIAQKNSVLGIYGLKPVTVIGFFALKYSPLFRSSGPYMRPGLLAFTVPG